MDKTLSGWDPDTYIPPECPACGSTLTVNWIERRSLRQPDSSWLPGRIECPTSRFHEITSSRRLVSLTPVTHPEHGAGNCPLSELDEWRTQGWYATDPEVQTPAEMVEQRVAELTGERA
jgi:hypothetical protein